MKLFGRHSLSILHGLSKNSFVKSVTKLVSGTLIGQLIVLGLSPVLTRIYSPEQFGLLSAFTSIVGTLWVVALFRYDLVLPLVISEKDVVKPAKFAINISLLFCAGLLIFLYAQPASFLERFELDTLNLYRWIIPAGILIIATYYLFDHWLIRKKQFGVISMVKVLQSGGMSFIQLGTGLISASGLSLILGYLGGYFLGICYQLFSLNKWGDLSALRHIKWKYQLAFAKRFKNFALFSTPASLANTGSVTLPPLLCAIVYSPEAAGFFVLAQRVLGLPINLVATSISQVFMGEVPEMIRVQPQEVKKLFGRISGGLAIAGIVPIVLVSYFASDIFSFIFGESWRRTGDFVLILSFMYFTRLFTTPVSLILNIFEKQHIQFVWDVFRMTGIMTIFFYAYKTAIDVEFTLLLFSVFMSFCYLLHYSICFFFVEKNHA